MTIPDRASIANYTQTSETEQKVHRFFTRQAEPCRTYMCADLGFEWTLPEKNFRSYRAGMLTNFTPFRAAMGRENCEQVKYVAHAHSYTKIHQ